MAISVSQLAGRTQQVLLARDYFYHLCEARANGFITSNEDYAALLGKGLQMIVAIEEADARARIAEANKAKEESDADKKKKELADAQDKLKEELKKAGFGADRDDVIKGMAFDSGTLAFRIPKAAFVGVEKDQDPPPSAGGKLTKSSDLFQFFPSNTDKKAWFLLNLKEWQVVRLDDDWFIKKIAGTATTAAKEPSAPTPQQPARVTPPTPPKEPRKK